MPELEAETTKKASKQNHTIQAFWVALGTIAQILLSLVSAMILSRYFNKEDYGTYKQILFVYSSLLVVFNAGLPKVFAYYLPNYSREEGKDIVRKVNMLLLASGAVFSLVLFLGAGVFASVLKNPALVDGMRLFAIVPFLLLPTLGLKGILSTYKLTQYIAVYMALSKLLMLICIIGPVLFWENSIRAALIGWIIASALSIVLAIVLINIPFKGIQKKKTSLSTNVILKYSLPIVWASLAGIAIKAADQFYISRYFGAETFAEYSNGFTELPLVGFITGATSIVLMPVFSKLATDEKNVAELIELWNSALYKSALVIFPMTFFFIFFAEPIVLLLFGDKYDNSIIYFQIANSLSFFKIILFTPLILALGKTTYYANFIVASAILAWVGGFVVVQFFDSPIWIALFSVVNSVLLVIIVFAYATKVLKVEALKMLPVGDLLKLFFQGIFVAAICFTLMNFIGLENKIVILILALSIFSALILLSGRLLNIDYMIVLRPLLKKLKRFT